ncbi:MAG: flagellar basal body rod protein FlgF [Parasphingorhabdus sp.]|nr:flagellar basal body rod protein FlgF [Parasphingorhabdus sp.]
MDKLAHSSLTAMRGIMAHQTAVANNIANANTTGFRAEIINARANYLALANGPVQATSDEQVAAADMASGTVTATGRPLDVALNGDAMLSVQAPDGATAYTRRGDLQVSDSGLVTSGSRDPVLGKNGPLVLPPFDKVSITPDGGVWIAPQGDTTGQLQQIDRLALSSFKGSAIVKGEDGLFRVPGGGILPDDPDARLTPASLEGSNVNMTKSLVEMIEASRAYETQVKLLSSAQEMDQAGAGLMRLP